MKGTRGNYSRDVELVPDPRKALMTDGVIDARHIKKRNRRRKGQNIVFNADDLKSYVTGFRKRKLDRKTHAKKKIAQAEKLAKRLKKKQQEDQLKAELGMNKGDKWVDPSSESEMENNDHCQECIYTSENSQTIVKIKPLHLSTLDSDVEEQ